ncbi:MAG: GC-type dockerin domain-anchored protein [Planctomycetota bacterium]
MTGFLSTVPFGAAVFINDITIAQFRDLGYETVDISPDDPADFDGDGIVSVSDLFAFVSVFTSGDENRGADFDENGIVNVSDLLAFLEAFTAAS